MKLTAVQIKNFRSIEDSETFQIGDITCLVGKNEAGKTAILKALLGIKPFGEYAYDRMQDYPRRYVSKYFELHKDGNSKVVDSTWQLSEKDKIAVSEVFGNGIFKNEVIKISSYIGRNNTWEVNFDEKKCLSNILEKNGIQHDELGISELTTSKILFDELNSIPQKTDAHTKLIDIIKQFRDQSTALHIIDILQNCIPKFFYTSHFERMSGEISVTKLETDKKNNSLSSGDKIFLNFLEYAGTSIEDLKNTKKHEELKAQCEGASNEITDEIFEFWSQNESLSVQIDFSEGKQEDEPPFNSGTIAKIRIYNSNHRVSVPLSERSAGFIWFFSFLSQFKQLKKETGSAILLLDEPGLTLHGKAQSDLLKYIQHRLLPEHQIIYTTHSPFMIPAERLADVRVVEDVVEYDSRHKATVKGTKVLSDVLSVDKDTIFPLQGHLGYEITQTLFIGKNTLLVEGPSDILYIQSISNALKKRKRISLSPKWTICPSGGIDKMISFASLFGGNKINVAVLCDYGKGDKGKVERLRQSQILNSGQIFTTSDFTGKNESDIEDFFDPDMYAEIINNAFSLKGKNIVTAEALSVDESGEERIVKAAEKLFMTLKNAPEFDHFTPADWLLKNSEFLNATTDSINKSLDCFEKVFITINNLLGE